MTAVKRTPTSTHGFGSPGLSERYAHAARRGARFKGWKAYANVLRGAGEHLLGAQTVRSPPLKLIFDPTNACQLACPLCPTGLKMIDRRTGHADIELFKRLMEQIGDYVFMIDFYNWGEPLLNQRLEDFIAVAHSYKVTSTISTNFSIRLSDERLDRLLRSGVNEIIISLDGTSKETHERYRRKSDFDLICDNVRRLSARRRALGQTRPLITWQFIVFGFNEHEMPRAREMAEELGVDRLAFRPPFLQTERYDSSLSETDRREIATWAPKAPEYQTHIAAPKKRRSCGWHYTAVAINWDGTVTPCCTTFRTEDDFGTFGKTGEHPFMKVVNNAAFRSARRALRREQGGETTCDRCPTPSVQDYHLGIYRRITLQTFVLAVEAMRRLLFRRRGAPTTA